MATESILEEDLVLFVLLPQAIKKRAENKRRRFLYIFEKISRNKLSVYYKSQKNVILLAQKSVKVQSA